MSTFLHQKPAIEQLCLYLTTVEWESLWRTSRLIFHAARREKPLRVAVVASRLYYSMVSAIRLGLLDVVIFLNEHDYGFPNTELFNYAAELGHVHVVKWMFQNQRSSCLPMPAFEYAAKGGYLAVVQWMFHRRQIAH